MNGFVTDGVPSPGRTPRKVVDMRGTHKHVETAPPVNLETILAGGSVLVTGGRWTYYDQAGRHEVSASWGAEATAHSAAQWLTTNAVNIVLLKLDTGAGTVTLVTAVAVPAYVSGTYYKRLATVTTNASDQITAWRVNWRGGNYTSIIAEGYVLDPDDHTIVIRDVTAPSQPTVADQTAIKNWDYEDAAPGSVKTSFDTDDYLAVRQTNDQSGADRITTAQADPIFVTWGNTVSEMATDLVDAGGPWGGGGAPWEDASAIDHGDLAGLSDHDHDQYWNNGSGNAGTAGAVDDAYTQNHGASIGNTTPAKVIDLDNERLQDADLGTIIVDWKLAYLYDTTGSYSVKFHARECLESDGNTVSFDWSARQAHIEDASVAHAVTDFAETNAALDVLGAKINALIAVFEAYKQTATS